MPGSELFITIPLQLKEAVFDLKGSVKDANSNSSISDAVVTLINGCGLEQISIPVDADGNFAVTLPKECSFVLKLEKEGYFTSTETFSTKGERLSKTFTKNILMPKSTSSSF